MIDAAQVLRISRYPELLVSCRRLASRYSWDDATDRFEASLWRVIEDASPWPAPTRRLERGPDEFSSRRTRFSTVRGSSAVRRPTKCRQGKLSFPIWRMQCTPNTEGRFWTSFTT